MADPRRVDAVPEITVFGDIGGQADVPGYFNFGDLGTLDSYLARPTNDPFYGITPAPQDAPPTLTPAPPLQPVTPPAPPANDPAPPKVPAPDAPPRVASPPEVSVTARRSPIATAASTSVAAAIFTEVLLPYVYNMFGVRYIPFLGVAPTPGGTPARRPGGGQAPAPKAVPEAGKPPALDQVIVTAPRTRPQPAPFATPLISPTPATSIMLAQQAGIWAKPLTQPRTRAVPRVRPAPRASTATEALRAWRNALNPRTAPAYNIGPRIAQPLLPLVPTPVPPTASPRPAPGPTPSPYVPPFNNPLDSLSIAPRTVPQPALDRCGCPKPKERKPREPRTTCRQGTYTQTAKGIIYTPRRTVTCR